MQYDHILIRYGEMALKGKNRKHFTKQLEYNVKDQIKPFPKAKVERTRDRMYIHLHGENHEPIVEACRHIFGIHSFSLAIRTENEEQAIKEAALQLLLDNPAGTTFKISCRRTNKRFPIDSQEMNQRIGAYVLQNSEGYPVNVRTPGVDIMVEIRERATYVTGQKIKGPGGLPAGSSGKTLLMLSGGIDSPVAGYLAMKRGVEIEAIHFHSPPYTNERAKQKVIDLAQSLSKFGAKVKIHVVPFTELQVKVHQEIPFGYSMTVMRRMMMRISERIAQKHGILSLATGESLGQVASQTMESMHTINEVTNYPVLRPLITMDKSDIIDISKQIDTYDISIRPYDDCCTVFVPEAPKTKPRLEKVHLYEGTIDFSAEFERAIEGTEIITASPAAEEKAPFADLL
ncbi:tRNA uracil 4-sulfurtransferase ThiI [Terribacillus saccharophilus]|uniref:tRNA uracil 4-sulfurtransferase ThiI n=1 Tax=Terribacillus saccharophilus TaxID=361277 RepID=UPI003981C618